MELEKKSTRSAAPVVGILGGGQLAKMLTLAALPLGIRVRVLAPDEKSTIPWVFPDLTIAPWTQENIVAFAQTVNVLALESEFVDADLLQTADSATCPVFPRPDSIRAMQDKLTQRDTLREAGLPVADYRPVASPDAVISAASDLGWPLVLKKRRNGYDGKGNATVNHPEDVPAAWAQLDGDRCPLYVEAFCRFEREIAVMVTRSKNGEIATYPVVDTVQKNHICHQVLAPADLPEAVQIIARDIAQRAVLAFDAIGTVGIELFRLPDGTLLINEMAPRVHNSGHYTIEACPCSQFENHVRAILGWPLGATNLRQPHAVMINLLGEQSGPGWPHGIEAALSASGVSLHLYGKQESRPGRKMGHLTATGTSREDVLARAKAAAAAIAWG